MSLLIAHREKQYPTQEELVEKAGVFVRTVQRIEAGAKPKGHTLRVLAKTLKVKEEDLIEDVVNGQHINSKLPKFSEAISRVKSAFGKLTNLSLYK